MHLFSCQQVSFQNNSALFLEASTPFSPLSGTVVSFTTRKLHRADERALGFTKDPSILLNIVSMNLFASFEFLAPSSGQSVSQLQIASIKAELSTWMTEMF